MQACVWRAGGVLGTVLGGAVGARGGRGACALLLVVRDVRAARRHRAATDARLPPLSAGTSPRSGSHQ